MAPCTEGGAVSPAHEGGDYLLQPRIKSQVAAFFLVLLTTCHRYHLRATGASCVPQSGDVCEGVVQSVRAFGAFLDLGEGVLGLLHVSQVSHERILNIAQVMQPGDRLKVSSAAGAT